MRTPATMMEIRPGLFRSIYIVFFIDVFKCCIVTRHPMNVNPMFRPLLALFWSPPSPEGNIGLLRG